jgi:hypothetical protein
LKVKYYNGIGTSYRIHGSDEKYIQNVIEPEWKRPLLRTGHRWEDNIKGILKEQDVKLLTPFM